jgi:hypothetical protein
MIASSRVIEAVSRLTGVPVAELKRRVTPDLGIPAAMDALDRVELVTELEDEFGEETVRWALRYVDVLAARSAPGEPAGPPAPQGDGRGPLWDRDLDG